MIANDQFETIRHELFSQREHHVYAVIDGAAVKELRFKLHQWQPEHCCLWSGNLEPDMAEVAPYLVRLEYDADFTRWLIEQGGDQHWNIYVTSPLKLQSVRKHLRQFLLVKDSSGETLVFRFYDPRIMRDYSAVIEAGQRDLLRDEGGYCYFTVNEGVLEPACADVPHGDRELERQG